MNEPDSYIQNTIKLLNNMSEGADPEFLHVEADALLLDTLMHVLPTTKLGVV